MVEATSSAPAVRVEGVIKRFGPTVALSGVDLQVPEGAVFGLLGPNGAGKTTLVRILATLLRPNGGRAEVLGHDVVSEPGAVRELLGLTGQFAAVDEILTGRENLEMFGRLFRLSRAQSRLRAVELLERFERRGVALVSVAESLDTGSAARRLVINIMTAVSQWEREAIGERKRDALSHKRHKGERVGNPPYGIA